MTNAALAQIGIVLVETTHPGNIGACARAMKTMGLTDLRLVRPKIFPSAESTARAAGADNLLASARIYDSLSEAIADCAVVVGTTARARSIPWPVLEPRECAARLMPLAQTQRIALVFGREHSGLNNDEVELCNLLVRIPANAQFSSLNIAAAVQILCYEFLLASRQIDGASTSRGSQHQPVAAEEMQRFFEHLERALIAVEFFDPEKPRRLMRRLHRLFNRAQLDRVEMSILRGILAAVEKATAKEQSGSS